MYFDPYGTRWGLAWKDGRLVFMSKSRDVTLEENITKDEAVSLAQRLESPKIGWVRIEQ